jgi:hypothetical protein
MITDRFGDPEVLMPAVAIDGQRLTMEEVEQVAIQRAMVQLSARAV